MERTPIDSSSIVSAGYDARSDTLEIEFVSGAVYRYFDVPGGVFDELRSAPSAGRFLNERIRDVYRYQRV